MRTNSGPSTGACPGGASGSPPPTIEFEKPKKWSSLRKLGHYTHIISINGHISIHFSNSKFLHPAPPIINFWSRHCSKTCGQIQIYPVDIQLCTRHAQLPISMYVTKPHCRRVGQPNAQKTMLCSVLFIIILLSSLIHFTVRLIHI